MTIENLKAKTKEMNISTTARAYSVDVRKLCTEEGFIEFGINSKAVDSLVMRLATVIEEYRPDEVIAAVGVLFVLLVKRFQFHVPNYLGFIENFLYRSRDVKLGCHAAERLIGCLFKDHVIRYEKIDFNHTRTVKLSRRGFDRRQEKFL